MNYFVVDAHTDVLLRCVKDNIELGKRGVSGHVDIPRLKEGGVKLQFFAVFVESKYKPDRATKQAIKIIETFYKELEKNKEDIVLIKNLSDFEKIKGNYKIGALLSIEGGEPIETDIALLDFFYRLGVRAMGLTWNERNMIANGSYEWGELGGLSKFGKDVVRRMNSLGMIIDVSHITPPGFWDVLEISEKPIIASHSNAYALCEHHRNLTDLQIKALADNGGVMGINFYSNFLTSEGKATLSDIVNHIDYIVELVGVEHVGLGSDFDGITSWPEEIYDATRFPLIFEELEKRGYKEEDIRKIAGENFLRIIKENWL